MLHRDLMTAALLLTATLGAAAPPQQDREQGRSPLGPAAARETFRVDPGLRVELVAAEPEVTSPVAIAFDERGRLWVVEMRDYPNGPAPGAEPEGRIKILEDRDGDGRFEHAEVFADGLLFANGVLPWGDGAIVTAAPHILRLRDTDGDGRADRREVLYEGFAVENPQLRVSHPTLGLDGWIYVANGLRGGKVRRAGEANADAEPIDLSGRDFRFDLVHDRAEPVAGMGQYGLTFDDWGRRFVCTNRNHLVPIVMEDRYTRRNPFLGAPGPASDDQTAGGAASVFPLTRQFTTSSLHIGSFSAACGVTIYRGDLLPDSYRGSAFTCEPTGNLVHQEVIEPHGAAFRWHPSRDGVEFLASTDEWARPVALAHGPNGALYVVDMYRAVIEHPQWMPPELRERPDLLDGKDRGRIWRIVPEGPADRPEPPRLGEATTQGLIDTLEHADAWWRTTAQRLLLQRQDPVAIEPLREMARSSENPLARIHAAWLLDHSGGLDDATVIALLEHDHPRVRENGALLAERRLSDVPNLRDAVIALADDPDARVRFQVALSLGFWADDRILDPLATVARLGADDRWTRLAVASAVPDRAGALVRTLLTLPHDLAARPVEGGLALVRELATLVGARRDPGECAAVLAALWEIDADADRWRLAGLDGLAEGLGRRGTRLGDFLAELPDGIAEQAASTLAGLAGTAEDPDRDLEARRDAIRLLAHAPWDVAAPVLGRMLNNEPIQEIRIASARALGGRPEPEAADRLLDPWRSLTPAVRREVAQALIGRPDRALALLDAIEAGRFTPRDLDAVQSRRLLDHRSVEVRDRARSLLSASLPADRAAVLDRYREAIELPGDPHVGREVFRRSCATCHRMEGHGVAVGPDIGDTRTRTKEALLSDILNPNGAIDANYVTYTVAMVDGRVLGGLIASETASALTLLRAEGQSDVVLKQEIEELRSDGVSLMPEGVEQDITVEQMADLLEYLKSWRYMDGTVPVGDGR